MLVLLAKDENGLDAKWVGCLEDTLDLGGGGRQVGPSCGEASASVETRWLIQQLLPLV